MSRRTAVDFTLRANITDLKSELGKVPGITEKEARKMASAMEKSLLRAEKAAKKAAMTTRGDLAQAIGKAVQMTEKLATAAGVTEEQFEGLKNQAMQLGGRVDDFADQLGRADSSLSAVAGAVQHLNPEMAEAARMMGDAMGAAEGLILAAAQAPAAFTVSALAAGALSLALAEVNEEMERNQREAERQEKIFNKLEKLTKNRTSIEHKLADAYGAQTDALFVSTRAHEENEKAIAAEVARADQLARANKGIRYQRIAEETRAWAQNQRRLNNELLQFQQQAKRNQVALQIEETQYKILQMATANRITDLNRLADASRAAGNAEHAAALTGAIDSAMTQQAVDKLANAYNKQQKETFDAARAQAEYAEKHKVGQSAAIANMQAVELTNAEYQVNVDTAEALEKQLEKLTGQQFALFDAQGQLIVSAKEYQKSKAKDRKDYQSAVFLANLETHAAYELNDATILKMKLQGDAADARKKQAKEEQQRLADEAQARVEALEKEVAAFTDASNKKIQAAKLQGMSESELLVQQFQNENARLDQITQSLEAEGKLTEDNEILIAEARLAALDSYLSGKQALEERTRSDESATAQARLEAIQAAATAEQAKMEESKLSTVELIDLDRQRQLAELAHIEATMEANKTLTLAMEQEIADARIEVNRAADAQIDDARAKRHAISMAALKNMTIDTVMQFEDLISGQLDQIAEKDRDRALRLFRVAKGIRASEAIVNGLTAVTTIIKDEGITPQSLAKAAMAVAIAGVQVAKIRGEEPSFHLGGVRPMTDPSETIARVLPGEAVLNRSATEMLGDSGVEQLNTGAGASIQVIPVPVYKHFDRFIRDENKRGGRFTTIVEAQNDRPLGQRGY